MTLELMRTWKGFLHNSSLGEDIHRPIRGRGKVLLSLLHFWLQLCHPVANLLVPESDRISGHEIGNLASVVKGFVAH